MKKTEACCLEKQVVPSEYDAFKDGLRQIMSVPKTDIDKREAEYQEQQQQKPPRKKKAA